MKVILLSLFIIKNTFAMCEYPHNPPVACLSGKVISTKEIKNDKYNCILSIEVSSMIRPASTYTFNSNLDRVDYIKAEKLLTKSIKLYSKGNCKAKEVRTLAEYNCSDRNADRPDMSLLDAGSIRAKIRDPWTEKSSLIDCQSLLSK